MKDSAGGGGGVDQSEVKIFSDFGVGSVDFLLKLGRFGLKSFSGFATRGLAGEANFVGNN